MKNVLLIISILLSTQSIDAHVTSNQHAHGSLVSEWSWMLIPMAILIILFWKYGIKSNKIQ